MPGQRAGFRGPIKPPEMRKQQASLLRSWRLRLLKITLLGFRGGDSWRTGARLSAHIPGEDRMAFSRMEAPTGIHAVA
jgi:hypothetical protein